MMDEARARKILGDAIHPDGGLDQISSTTVVIWSAINPRRRWDETIKKYGESTATLDGQFTADELEAIAWWMRYGATASIEQRQCSVSLYDIDQKLLVTLPGKYRQFKDGSCTATFEATKAVANGRHASTWLRLDDGTRLPITVIMNIPDIYQCSEINVYDCQWNMPPGGKECE